MPATDAEVIASMQRSGKPGAFSVPLQEPAQFATSGAQINLEITEMAMRNEPLKHLDPPRSSNGKRGPLAGRGE